MKDIMSKKPLTYKVRFSGHLGPETNIYKHDILSKDSQKT